MGLAGCLPDRNIVLEISYYTKSLKLLGTSLDTLKESVDPNSKKLFEFTTKHFPKADSLKIAVVSADNID